jgi:hypothetical protein
VTPAGPASPAARHGPRALIVAVLLAAAAFVSSPLHAPLNNPNEGVRVFATRALVEHHTTAIDTVVADWGYIDDKATRDGHLYSSKAPFVTLLAAAAYAVVHPVTGDLARSTLTRLCRVTGVVLPTAVALALAWHALRRRCRDPVTVDLGVVALVTGTGLLGALHVFSGHALVAATAAALAAFALLDDVPTRGRLVVVGALWSASTCAEYPAVLLGPLLFPVVARAPRRAGAVAAVVAAAVVVALPTLIVHTASFGAPWRTGYSFLENAGYRPLVAGTLFGIGVPAPGVLATALFSSEVGLFFFAPVTLVGVAALPRLPRGARVVVIVVVVAFLAFLAGFRGWRGGWSIGPRYISELWGVLAVVAVVALDDVRPALARGALATTGAVGILHSGIAGATFPHLPDVLVNPVGELVLPLVVRGLAPDSVPLALGLSPANSVVVIVAVVAAPLVVCLVLARAARIVVVVVVVVAAAVVIDRALPGTRPGPRALEVRRLVDNWRPERGVPYLADGGGDPRVLFAIDRGRFAPDPTCTFPAPRRRRPDLGAGARVLDDAALPDAGLVVVADELADAIAPHGGGALVVTVRDVATHLRRGLPCTGDVVVVVRAGDPLPPALASAAAEPPTPLAGGWSRIVVHRSPDVAPAPAPRTP